LLLALATGACVACTAPGPPPTASAPSVAAIAKTAPPAAKSVEQDRERYIMHALAGDRLPGLEGLRHIGGGTGFYFTSDKILTNYHVAGPCTALTVGNGIEGSETLAKIVATDPADDLAVLGTTATVPEPARFETAVYTETGAGMAIVGYPEHGLLVLEAELSPVETAQRDLVSDRPKFPFRGAVRRGNSGSPVLDDSGTVVGVVEAKIDTVAVYQNTGKVVDNIGYAISNRVVLDFLRANGIAFLPARPAPSLTKPQLLDRAHGFVRQIGCWK
jgi:S1-C subfamily serine protease